MDTNKELLKDVPEQTRIWFEEEKLPYKVRARNDRYLVCTKPFNPQKTVLYTIVDIEKNIRGTENLIIGFGAETDDECAEMISRLEGRDTLSEEDKRELKEAGVEPGTPIHTEVSRRNRISLKVRKTEIPIANPLRLSAASC